MNTKLGILKKGLIHVYFTSIDYLTLKSIFQPVELAVFAGDVTNSKRDS